MSWYDPYGSARNFVGKSYEKKVSSEGSMRQVIGPEKRVGPC